MLRGILLLLFITVLSAPARSEDGLVAHWPMNDTTGITVADRSGGGVSGELHGVLLEKIKGKSAVLLDGKSAYISFGRSPRLLFDDKLSISAWVFPRESPTGEPLIVGESPDNWGITHFNGRVWFYISSGTHYCHAELWMNRWQHVAATYDGRMMRLYVDGRLLSSRELPADTRINSSGTCLIGADARKQSFFSGAVNDVRLYNRVLSDKEVMAIADPEGNRLPLSERELRNAEKFFKNHRKPVEVSRSGRQLWMANTHTGIEFIEGDGRLVLSRLYGVRSGVDFLPAFPDGSQQLWRLSFRKDRERDRRETVVSSSTPAEISSKVESHGSATTLRLTWRNLDIAEDQGCLDVEVLVTLTAHDPLSRWRISVTNRSEIYGIWEVGFPMIELVPIGGDKNANRFIAARGRGIMTDKPFEQRLPFNAEYPGGINMQYQALFDLSGNGLYLAAHDGEGYSKQFQFEPNPAREVLSYRVNHYPANMGYPAEDYRMTYDVTVGPFSGDWYDASMIYRNWANKQVWCSRGNLVVRKDIPRWFKEAPLMLNGYTNRGDSGIILMRDRMLRLQEFFGRGLPFICYAWKEYRPEMTDYNVEGSPWKVPEQAEYPCGNEHDGNYPKLPALPSFAQVCEEIGASGGSVAAYVCASIYDPGLNENAPYAGEAKPFAVRDEYATIYPGEGLPGPNEAPVAWRMCPHTEWWRTRMKETVTGLMEMENVHSIYFDTFYGGRFQCFGTDHGHSYGGGNDSYLGERRMAEVVRGAMKEHNPDSVMTGESCAETAIDLIDGTLMVYTIDNITVPMFAVVYGDYFPRYGRWLRPESDGFYVQAATMFTEGMQMGRLYILNADYLDDTYRPKMEFLRRLANFWNPGVGMKYLAYGRYLGPPAFGKPDPMPTFTYNETLSGRGEITVPALQSGVFAGEDGSIGVFIVNVSDKALDFSFNLPSGRYPVSESKTYRVAMVDESGARGKSVYLKDSVSYSGRVEGHDVLLLDIIPR